MISSTEDDFSLENIKILSIDFETRQIIEDTVITRSQIFAAGFCSNIVIVAFVVFDKTTTIILFFIILIIPGLLLLPSFGYDQIPLCVKH
jgi:hypothetical protein